MKIHIDAHSGIAGNMFLGACLDLGLEQAELVAALRTLSLPAWVLQVTRECRGGLSGLYVHVVVPSEQEHRHLSEICAIIQHSGLPEPVKARACAIFQILAEAEGAVHGVDPDRVHFHEVGAVDAIIDICGAAYAAWRLAFTAITASPIPLGSGIVTCQHGQMPVPVPAVVHLLRRYQVPIRPDTQVKELVTPTGMAILVHLVEQFTASRLTRIDRSGYGLGSRELPGQSNGLRLLAQDEESPPATLVQRQWVVVLSTHVDDMNPEWYGPLWDHLFSGGALDVALLPMTMKKGRPGVRIEVIATPGDAEQLAHILLTQTTTLGVRMATVERLLLPRTQGFVDTPWGRIGFKESGAVRRVEHDDLVALAARQGWTLLVAQQNLAPWLSASSTTPKDS